ncbi:MAG: hypothetical protein R3F31_03335 [Verrucomicrobiales bacterium]
MSHELLLNEEVYHRFIQKEVPEARRFVWIATADVKDLHVASGKRFVPSFKSWQGSFAKGSRSV